jgi:zinc protease
MSKHKQLLTIFFVVVFSINSSWGQQPLDRTKAPLPGKAPELHVPGWTKTALSNGATLIVSERRGLPLVSFSLTLVGGSNQFEPGARRGVAGITTQMLSEGTTTRTGDQLSDALQLLGTDIRTNIGPEEGTIGFVSTTRNFAGTLALLADMILNSTFPAEALERVRGRTLVGLAQAKDQPTVVGAQVFAKVLYGNAHPYGQRATESSVKAITRDDVVTFEKAYFQPGRALITVVGDVNAAQVKSEVEKAFAAWQKAGDKPSFDYPKLPERRLILSTSLAPPSRW